MIIEQRKVLGSWEEFDNKSLKADIVGGKAIGLFYIPKQWTLPFIVLTKHFFFAWRRRPDLKKILEGLSQTDQKAFEHFFKKILSPDSKIFVRSNSPSEDISVRGKFQSNIVNNTINEIERGISELINSSEPEPMYCILQTCVDPGLPGHFSNERRVSENRTRWMVEINDHQTQEFINSTKQTFEKELIAKREKEIFTALRKIGGTLNAKSDNEERFHCEWVWDGNRVWIVQVDIVINQKSSNDAKSKIEMLAPSVPGRKKFKVLKHFRETDAEKWKKLRSPIQFLNAGLPVCDVYLLSGVYWSNSEDIIFSNIREDIIAICKEHPIIVRCDIAKSLDKDDLLLPTSGALNDIDEILMFFESVSNKFNEQGLTPSDWTFLISYLFYVPASALIHAFPNAQRIQIDALWGYPDGLLYYPHDTFYFYTNDNKTKQVKNYKSACLFPDSKGWTPFKITKPYDWKNVLSRKEIITLGDWALKLANSIGKEVQLMAFTKVKDGNAVNGCLPWHYTDLPVPQYSNSLRILPDSKTIRTIRSWSDLMNIENKTGSDNLKGLIIMPSSDMLRDDNFLSECGLLAYQKNIPLYFQGSLLGHAYYIMTKTGANVIPIAKSEPKEQRVTYNKLVRDKIPIIIKEAGGLARIRRLSKEEAITLLSQKVIEESFEIWNSNNTRELLNEIADTTEVLESLVKFSEFSQSELEEVKSRKIKKRGGFEDLIFLEETAIRPLKNIVSNEGELPLFFEDNTLRNKKSTKTDKLIKFMSSQESPEFLHFEVPLIPQIDKSLKPKSLVGNFNEFSVIVNYENNNLNIKVIQSSEVENRRKPQKGEEGYQFSIFS